MRKWGRHFLTWDFLKLYASYKKTNDIFGTLGKFWARNMCFLCKNIDLGIWPDLDLTSTWPPSKVRLDDVIGSNDCSHRYLLAKWPRKHVSQACLWLLFYIDLFRPDLNLDIFNYVLHTHAVSFVDIYPALWVSVSSSNQPVTPECENASLWPLTCPGPDTWP